MILLNPANEALFVINIKVSSKRPLRIAVIAGEVSGDILAAGLINKIKRRYPDTQFEGIGGEHMQSLGVDILYSMDNIALMGVESVIFDIRNILKIRKTLTDKWIKTPPDCFIGVDVPDFNFSLERQLRQVGIPVVHYVSPSVWAWRGYRIKKIKRSVDQMLTLFPFEKKYYDQHQVPATFIGHPGAQKALNATKKVIRANESCIALLPGSRRAEVKSLLPVLLDAAQLIHTKYPKMHFVLPFANQSLMSQYQAVVTQSGLPIKITLRQSSEAFSQSFISLVASGTAALEALFHGSVMVVFYKVGWLTFILYSALKHIDHFSLPNQLLNLPEITELSQKQVTAQNIFKSASELIEDKSRRKRLEIEFGEITKSLCLDTDSLAADIVLNQIQSSSLE